MNLADYETVNSPEFIASIRPSGPGGRRLQDRVIRRFLLSGAQIAQGVKPGSITITPDNKQIIADWKDFRWKIADEFGHYAWLHFVAQVRDENRSWWVEKLRLQVEAGGTSSINANEWLYDDAARTPYPDFWSVLFDGKIASPVVNRGNEPGLRYRPIPGALCAFWVGGWTPDGSDARSDLHPFRYPGSSAPPVEPVEPVEPVDPPSQPTTPTDEQIRYIAQRTAELIR